MDSRKWVGFVLSERMEYYAALARKRRREMWFRKAKVAGVTVVVVTLVWGWVMVVVVALSAGE
jgi:hypothetical protein